jgi:hypothetical protein
MQPAHIAPYFFDEAMVPAAGSLALSGFSYWFFISTAKLTSDVDHISDSRRKSCVDINIPEILQ